MTFGPITERERLRWQVRTLRTLADLLAAHPDLPPVTFTVPPGLQASALLRGFDGDESRRRAVAAAYAAVLDATVTERDRSLLVSARVNNVKIVVVADLDRPEPGESR